MKNERQIDNKITKHFDNFNQAIILLGARQVGKTTLLKRLFGRALYLLADESQVAKMLETYDSSTYKQVIGNYKQIIIDELHLLSNPGRVVKIMYDQIPDIQIIVTGSSSFQIRNKTSESMAGRAIDYHLYPLTLGEYLYQLGIEDDMGHYLHKKVVNLDSTQYVKLYDLKHILEQILLYGQYPEILNIGNKKLYLENLVEKVIFKDIIGLGLLDNLNSATELLKVLAYQIGNLINYSEIAGKLQISVPTVQRYIQIFEQSFIIYRVYPFSRNGRDEIGKMPKIYFWDLGLRNALIKNWSSINIRSDSGSLFENFIINEIKKENDYLNLGFQMHYWRLKSGSEVDLIIKSEREIVGCEIKLNGGKFSSAFRNRYPEAKTHIITMNNLI